MNKGVLLRWINISLFFSFCLQAVTSLVLFFEINTPWLEFISKFHEYNGLLMISLVIGHIFLNWGWVKINIFKKKTR